MLSPAVCGKSSFKLLLGVQSLGSEAFEIDCRGGVYAASGHTQMKLPGLVIDISTTIETDKEATPAKFTLKGMLGASALDQAVTVMNDKATIIDKGVTSEAPYAKGATFLVPNVTYLYQFIGAHYDTSRGGPQKILVFPNYEVTMERVARDEVLAEGASVAVAVRPTSFDRYSLQMAGVPDLIIWADRQGRLAAFAVPAQNFIAIREEYASFAVPLMAALSSALKARMPDYSAPPDAPYTAEEVTIERKGYKLAGTLLLPKTGGGPFPAVVTSTGSGQETRDENMPLPGLENYRPFRQIAERLASRGIAVLRVDDRGVGSSTGLDTLDNATTFDFADDVRAQVAYLRTRREIDPARIAVIGHSEGGVIAPLVAANDPRLAAIVILAGTAQRGDVVLLYQLDLLYASDPKMSEEERERKRAENRASLRAIADKGDVSKYQPIIQILNRDWTRAFLAYEPLPTIRRVRQPILILQGALDHQVTPEQASMLAQAARAAGNRDVTVRVFPNLNHLFLPAKTGEESEYATLDTNAVPDEPLDALTSWLQQKLKAKAKSKAGRTRGRR
ncbi:MAG TPA: alpha/beta fold hydrolase [Pyrinomonadaceae bacterium]